MGYTRTENELRRNYSIDAVVANNGPAVLSGATAAWLPVLGLNAAS